MNEPVKKLEDMSPADHMERAMTLIQAIDAKFDENGNSQVTWMMTPVNLSLADAHMMLADLKNEGLV